MERSVSSDTSRFNAKEAKQSYNKVEHLDEEIKFIKRYVGMNGKKMTDKQMLNFLNALQQAIMEKKIRKTSPYARQIKYMQDNIVRVCNSMDTEIDVVINEGKLNEFLSIIDSVKIRPSVAYIKKYISAQGKFITKEKAQKLLDVLSKATNSNEVPSNDPYVNRINQLRSYLTTYISKVSMPDRLPVMTATLDGWQEALNGCVCGKQHPLVGLAGIEDGNVPPEAVMNSVDFSKIKFQTLGFKGKWLDLIGDPSGNFSAMIFGKPKFGKSYLALDLAGYLARSFGPVLYVAREEKLSHTFQEKVKSVQHPNLMVTGALPDDLSLYSFIFFDSVSTLGLKPKDLEALKDKYPDKSFIFIFQVTKQGNFRGENGFQHDVDIVIEVPEKGKAVQMGRFNQGGEMDIFPGSIAA